MARLFSAAGLSAVLLLAGLGLAPSGSAAQGTPAAATAAASKVVAVVNGRALTEQDLTFAEAEVGQDLGSLPPETRRRVLVEYLIENVLFAEAAEKDKIAQSTGFEQRLDYWRRRALRDAYFEKSVKSAISDAEARSIYDRQVGSAQQSEEVRARHILVDTEQLAKDIHQSLLKGIDFAELSRKHSKDPGSKENGGDLGYFQRGQMVPQFEETAFKLAVGAVSAPVQSQFGWHIIKVDDRRTKPLPSFEEVKDRLVGSLVHRKAQEIAQKLRQAAKIDFIDLSIKRQVEAEAAGAKPKLKP